MTKQEWFDCDDIKILLQQVESTRKKRLFSLACCRSIEHLMLDQRSKDCLEKTELFIDGKIDEEMIDTAFRHAKQAWFDAEINFEDGESAYWAAKSVVSKILFTWGCASRAVYHVHRDCYLLELTKQLELLRDIYNPFLLDLKFSDQAISLAEQVYEGDDNARGILSDCLEDEGYPSEVVAHLKSGFHPKGCWLIDQILGKE